MSPGPSTGSMTLHLENKPVCYDGDVPKDFERGLAVPVTDSLEMEYGSSSTTKKFPQVRVDYRLESYYVL